MSQRDSSTRESENRHRLVKSHPPLSISSVHPPLCKHFITLPPSFSINYAIAAFHQGMGEGRWARQRQLKTCMQAEDFRMFVAFCNRRTKVKILFTFSYKSRFWIPTRYMKVPSLPTNMYTRERAEFCRIYYSSTSPHHTRQGTYRMVDKTK